MRVGVCSRIVARFDTWWAFMAWSFFVGSILLQFNPGTLWLAGVCFVLMVAWWIIDVVDQSIPAWQIATGVLMLVIAALPRGFILFPAAWVIYWTRVRE